MATRAKRPKAKATAPPSERLDRAVLNVMAEAQLRLPDGTLWQRPPWMTDNIVTPLLRLRPDGRPQFEDVYLEGPKGVGKTLAVDAVLLCEAVVRPTLVLVAARDKDATKVDKDFMVTMIRQSPLLKRRCRVLEDRIEVPETGSRIAFLPSDERSVHGGGGNFPVLRILMEDPFAWPDLVLMDSLLSISAKAANTQTILATNPGPRRSGRLWQLRERLQRRHGKTAWCWMPWAEGQGPPVPWITPQARERLAEVLPPAFFSRFADGRWSELGSFVPRDVVRRCVGTHASRRAGSEPLAIGLDVGLRKHRLGLAWAVAGDGKVWCLGAEGWDPRATASGEIQFSDVAEAIGGLARGFPHASLTFDPWQALHLAQELKGLVQLEEFSFGPQNQCKLSSVFFEALSKGTLVLPADVPDLADEIASLDVEPVGMAYRFVAGTAEYGHADRAVALALSVFSVANRPGGLMGLKPRPDLYYVAGRRASAPASPLDRSLIWSSGGTPSPFQADRGSGSMFDLYDEGKLPGQHDR